MIPDFITATNEVERRGVFVRFSSSKKGVIASIYKGTELIKKGEKYYDNCLTAQKEVYLKIYQSLNIF